MNVPFVLATLVLVPMAGAAALRRAASVRLDWLGAVLTALGLAGPVLALINPSMWWASAGRRRAAVGFVVHERRVEAPMLPLDLFARRNFLFGNLQTFAMYGGSARCSSS